MASGFSVLVVSGVENKYVKDAAQKSDFNKNDRIDTPKEWKALLDGIARNYAEKNITYNTAKKYVDLSSNGSFVKKDKLNSAYRKGFDNGLNDVKENKLYKSCKDKKNLIFSYIKNSAIHAEEDEENKEYLELGRKAENIHYVFRAYEPTEIKVGMKFGDYSSAKKEQEEHAKANGGEVGSWEKCLTEKNIKGAIISELRKSGESIWYQKVTKDGVWFNYTGKDGKFTKICGSNNTMAVDKNGNGIVDANEIEPKSKK